MNKKERLEKIRRFVTDYQIGTQEEIVDAGIATQMENLRERLGHLDTQESE